MKYPIANKSNLLLFMLLVFLNVFSLIFLPFLLSHNLLWSLLLLPTIFLSNTYWALIHEGIHFLFHPSKKVNEACSRVMSIFFGCSFNILRMAHLMHHRHNRSQHDRPEVYEMKKHNWLIKSLHYYWFLMNGLYLIEMILPLMSFFPKSLLEQMLNKTLDKQPDALIIEHIKKQISRPGFLAKIRNDTAAIILVYTISFILYGANYWILLCIILVRGFLISVADNLPHYNTPLDNKYFAYNLSGPKWLSLLLLNSNYHRIHHRAPNIPWHLLPEEFSRQKINFDLNYFQQWINQFTGLIEIDTLESSDSFTKTQYQSQIDI